MDSLFEMARFDPSLEEGEDKQDNLLEDINKKIKEKRKIEVEPNNEAKHDGISTEPAKKKKKKGKKKSKENADLEGFIILGDQTETQKKKVSRVLPYWLANPDILTVDLKSEQMSVGDMTGLAPTLVTKLAKEGITHFFPVQRQMIPHLLSGQSLYPRYRPSDLCVSAPTGSGKTLAFVLPIVSSLMGRMVPRVRALVVLPTQDLALQVYKVFTTYCQNTGLRVKLLTGGETLAGEDQLIRRGVGGMVHQLFDILVVTPGRLIHTIRDQPALDLSHLRYLVIDEADRMMDNIANDWLNNLETAVYSSGREIPGPLTAANAAKRLLPLQKLLFSATLSQDPEKLEQLNLFEPKLFRCVVPPKDIVVGEELGQVGEFTLPAELSQFHVTCQTGDKPLMVSHLVKTKGLNRVLVFTHNNESVHRLALLLTHLGHKTGELHSLVKKRKKMLGQLESGTLDILVCSDALARGIDVTSLDGVISYDAPTFVKTYIHRVGRTARAGNIGTAITICDTKQIKSFTKMVRDANINNVEQFNVSEDELKILKELYSDSLEKTKQQLEQEKVSRIMNKKSQSSGKGWKGKR